MSSNTRMLGAAIAVLAWSLGGAAHAQQANVNLDYNPQKNTENLVPFSAPLNSPDVRDDRTATFRLKAPEAHGVALAGVALLTALGQDKPVPFQKGADGIWSLTVGPLRPDMYVYYFVVDGVQVADPSNTIAGFTAMPPYSQLVVHADGPAYYDARDVPHGAITRHVYHSGVTSGERDLYVYTPPGYDRTRKYPVLYLVGGSGELPHNWIDDGRVNLMMDNLLAEGKAVPMIIAVPNNQVVHRNNPKHAELTFPLFEAELRKHVIPLVESQYSVRTDPGGRALSGLSMGGRHTMFVGFKSLDLFASFGVLSAGDVNSETSIASFLNDPGVNDKVAYLFVGQGTGEAKGRIGERCVALHEALLKHNVRHEYYVGGYTGHDWATWRHLLYYRFLPGLWRGQTLPASGGTAKVAGGSRPASTNVLGAQYPQVTEDGRVVFQFKAPGALRVQADIMGTKYDMVKDDAGVWTATTPPLVPGFHYYQLVVDGTSINDPGSHTFFGVGRDFSGIEIPEKGVDYYLPKDVPHGQVRTLWYHSAVTGSWRRCLVYTPPGYDTDHSTRYPVLYLQHGSGEDETGWVEQGRANFVLDNLIAEKKAVPMIIVMDKGYATRLGETAPSAQPPTVVAGTVRAAARGGSNAFGDVVITDLIPFIDRTFRTLADRERRAMAGLSMGGNQACQITLANLDRFAWIGMFSGTGIGLSTQPFDPKTAFGGVMADAASFNRKVHLVWIGLGTAEPNPFPGSIKAFRESLDKGGLKYVYFESPGTAHEWLTWRRDLNDFAPRLFRQ